jgi:probable rRNA maturation factor
MDPARIRKRIGKILRDLGYPEAELSLLFTDDEGITELNRRYLKRDNPTNVLAFPMTDAEQPEFATSMLGDIVISLDAALRDAQACGETLERTVDRLLVHGLLHLLGYEHEGSRQEARRMEKEEKRLLAMIASPGSGISELDDG